MTASWVEFWNRDTPIYVNERHKTLHYRGVARDIAGLVQTPGAHVLDHGSGEATSADLVAAKCAKLWLCDAAGNTRAKIAEQFKDDARIVAIAPDRLGDIPDESLDLIVANSVLQYLDSATFEQSLEVWRDKLKPDGRLVLADVIPPDVSPITDARALLSFAWEGGFVLAAMAGLARTFFSDYRQTRERLGFSMHTEQEILDRLGDNGFSGRRMAKNIGHNPARMSFEAKKV